MSRVAIYVCDCMGLVSDDVDTESVERLARTLEGAVLVQRVGMLCSRARLDVLADELRESRIGRLIFVGCSPRMSLKLPEELLIATAEQGGVDPSLVEVANIREQCAWIHRGAGREAASAKARDLLRMAHARLMAGEPSLEPVRIANRALVIGAGPAGLSAAKDLAVAGVETVLVERASHVGGVVCQLPFMFQTECWPSTCENSCVGPVQAQRTLLEPLVQLHTSARVEQVVKRDGNFCAEIERAPRFVDADLCITCDRCTQACPVQVDGHKAIDRPFPRAMPPSYTLFWEACTLCGECAPVCPTDAIDLRAGPTRIERSAGAVILATGTRQRDPDVAPARADGTRHPDVVTALQFEQMLAHSLSLVRPSDGEPMEHLVFVQCAGSRVGVGSERKGVPYCSKTCCAITAKQARRVATASPETEVSVVYYRDFRTYERALEKLHQDLRAMGIAFLNGEVTAIAEGGEGGLAVKMDLLGTEEQEQEGESDLVQCDLVVLACAQEPELPLVTEPDLGVPLDAFGFPIEAQPRMLRPTETFVDRVYAVGSAAGPKTIQHAVEQGSTAALRVIEALRAGARQPVKHSCRIRLERCSGCGICLSVCPHGAIRITDDGAQVDAAFCQGCGMCAASCPSHAAALRGFSDELILEEVRQAFCEAPAQEPRILALLCYWCAYGGVDLAGIEGLEAPTGFRPIRIRCSSSVNTGLLFEMFRLGVDGIIVAGCPHNSCHHMWGNWLAEKRLSLARALLQQMGLDDRRLVFENIGLMHARKFVDLIQRKRAELLALGPNPLTRTGVAREEGGDRPWLQG